MKCRHGCLIQRLWDYGGTLMLVLAWRVTVGFEKEIESMLYTAAAMVTARKTCLRCSGYIWVAPKCWCFCNDLLWLVNMWRNTLYLWIVIRGVVCILLKDFVSILCWVGTVILCAHCRASWDALRHFWVLAFGKKVQRSGRVLKIFLIKNGLVLSRLVKERIMSLQNYPKKASQRPDLLSRFNSQYCYEGVDDLEKYHTYSPIGPAQSEFLQRDSDSCARQSEENRKGEKSHRE